MREENERRKKGKALNGKKTADEGGSRPTKLNCAKKEN